MSFRSYDRDDVSVEEAVENRLDWMEFGEFGDETQYVLYDVDDCQDGLEAFVIADESAVVELPGVADAQNMEEGR